MIRVGLFATHHQRIHHHRAFTDSAHQHRIEVHRGNEFVRILHHRTHGHRHVRRRRHIQRCIVVHVGRQGGRKVWCIFCGGPKPCIDVLVGKISSGRSRVDPVKRELQSQDAKRLAGCRFL